MTLDDIVQEVRALSVEDRKRLIGLIVDTLTESEAPPAPKKRSILEFEGLGAEIWKDIDTDAYLNELRDEWDQRR
jgi:hypothetical protein